MVDGRPRSALLQRVVAARPAQVQRALVHRSFFVGTGSFRDAQVRGAQGGPLEWRADAAGTTRRG